MDKKAPLQAPIVFLRPLLDAGALELDDSRSSGDLGVRHRRWGSQRIQLVRQFTVTGPATLLIRDPRLDAIMGPVPAHIDDLCHTGTRVLAVGRCRAAGELGTGARGEAILAHGMGTVAGGAGRRLNQYEHATSCPENDCCCDRPE